MGGADNSLQLHLLRYQLARKDVLHRVVLQALKGLRRAYRIPIIPSRGGESRGGNRRTVSDTVSDTAFSDGWEDKTEDNLSWDRRTEEWDREWEQWWGALNDDR